jgi:hypothetical protein
MFRYFFAAVSRNQMRLPTIQGTIRRRILANFRVDPQAMQTQLPARFRPKLHDGFAVAGICMIRLDHIRPKLMPEIVGISSENAAHRVAVLWDEDGSTREGVFISRRIQTLNSTIFWAGASFLVSITSQRSAFTSLTHR